MVSTETSRRRFAGTLFSVVAIIILLGLTWRSSQTGLGSFYARYAAATNQISVADAAVTLNGSNADGHYVRATLLEPTNLPSAIREHYEAAKARPEDYALWLSLARALELNGDMRTAIAAATQAIPLAPSYAQPHYQLGNLLLRAGETREGFAELRLAGISEPTLMPGIVDLAWRISSGNPEFVEQVIAPATAEDKLLLANFFKAHQQVDAAIRMFAMSGAAGESDRRAYVGDLIAAGRFEEAAKLWKVVNSESVQYGQIRDPGFEKATDLGEPGFHWRAPKNIEGVRYALDPETFVEGRSSLRLEFTGGAPVMSPVLSQVVLVEAEKHYELRFSAKSESLVTGALPQILILEASTRSILAQSVPFEATGAWREYTIPFASGAQTKAIEIVIQRPNCDRTPCPIFGRLWLDKFALSEG
ncbi:MAG TPA: hypothetical protein VGJ48_18180 [Pyrinomonadaceae bacterium]